MFMVLPKEPWLHCIYPLAVSMDQDKTGEGSYNILYNMIYTLKIEH